MDIGDICDYCEERDCKFCSLGNPCLGCNDYDLEKDICKSNGGCGEMIEKDKMKMNFEKYGILEWLEPEEYWQGDWSPKDIAKGADGEEYDILFSRKKQEYRYSTI